VVARATGALSVVAASVFPPHCLCVPTALPLRSRSTSSVFPLHCLCVPTALVLRCPRTAAAPPLQSAFDCQ